MFFSLDGGGTTQNALAHSVYIYAWPEGSRLCTESYYTRDYKVHGGEVSMLAPDNSVLGVSATDEKGIACFTAPEKAVPLKFVLSGGQGHRAEFQLTEDEVREATASRQPDTTPSLPGTAPRQPDAAPVEERKGYYDQESREKNEKKKELAPGLTETALREIVREELQSQLGPLRQSLAQAAAPQQPGIKEIGGGIGWIMGLASLAYIVTSRYRKK